MNLIWAIRDWQIEKYSLFIIVNTTPSQKSRTLNKTKDLDIVAKNSEIMPNCEKTNLNIS